MTLAAAFVAAMLAQSASLPIRVIDSGAQSGIEARRQVTISTAAEFAALWREHAARPLPTVDFATESVVGIFLGARPTAGYRVEVVSVVTDASGSLVRYREQAPPSDAVTAQVLTYPFVVVSVPTLRPPVRFESIR